MGNKIIISRRRRRVLRQLLNRRQNPNPILRIPRQTPGQDNNRQLSLGLEAPCPDQFEKSFNVPIIPGWKSLVVGVTITVCPSKKIATLTASTLGLEVRRFTFDLTQGLRFSVMDTTQSPNLPFIGKLQIIWNITIDINTKNKSVTVSGFIRGCRNNDCKTFNF